MKVWVKKGGPGEPIVVLAEVDLDEAEYLP